MTDTVRVAVVGDTGPLLCAGGLGARDGLGMLKRRFAHRISIPTQVQRELRNLERRSGEIGRAATLMAGRQAAVLKVDTTQWTRSSQEQIRQAIIAVEERRARRQNRSAKTGGHGGEVDAILLAQKLGAILITNDIAAREVARSQGLATASFATVVAAEIADGRLDAPEGAALCARLDVRDFYIGMKNPSAQALAGLEVPEGL